MKIGDKVVYNVGFEKYSIPYDGDVGYIKEFSKDNECCLVKFQYPNGCRNVWCMIDTVELIK